MMNNDMINKIIEFEAMAQQDVTKFGFDEFVRFTHLTMDIANFFVEQTAKLWSETVALKAENERLNALFDQMMEIQND